jgi:hypothetical protein
MWTVEGQPHSPAVLAPRREPRFPSDGRLSGPDTRSGHCGRRNICCARPESKPVPLVVQPWLVAQMLQLTVEQIPSRGTEYIIIYKYTGCSFCFLDVQNILSADTLISRQTEGHSFGDHLIIGSVSVIPSSVTEASIATYSVPLWLVWASVQRVCSLNTRYIQMNWSLLYELFLPVSPCLFSET